MILVGISREGWSITKNLATELIDLNRKTTVTSGFNVNYKHCLIRRRTEQERNEYLSVLQHTRDKIKYTKQVGTFRPIQKEDS